MVVPTATVIRQLAIRSPAIEVFEKGIFGNFTQSHSSDSPTSQAVGDDLKLWFVS
jgi:hypothetical protein